MTETLPTAATGVSTAAPTRGRGYLAVQLLLLSAGALVATGQMYLPLPLLQLIADSTGGTVQAASWTVTAFAAGYAVGFLVLGPLGPRVGYRGMITLGLGVTAALTLLAGSMPTIQLVLVVRVAQGFAASAFGPAAMAYITRHFPAHRRALAFAVLTSSFLASAVLAQVGAQALGDTQGWRAPFLTSALATAVVTGLTGLLLTRDVPDRSTRPSAAYRGMLAAATTPRLIPLFLVALAVLFGFVGLYAAIQLINPLDVAANPTELLTLRASALPAIVLAPVLMQPFSRVPPGYRLALSVTAAALFLVLAALSAPTVGSVALFTVLLGCFVLAIALAAPSALHVISANAAHNVSGASAMYSFWLFLGSTASAPVVAGFAPLGFTGVSVVFAVVMLLGAGAALLSARRSPNAAAATA
ncbi:putative MFS family arabinose efflux permease [Haloactinospora alba]|uniref:Putative MFS family arabinose efflux permease n=1 Tax=Haloactinospora alba TaxID=405555 RepID=A0A543NFP6_9ACTN|nr:MFS transporter [Haloactinospora alba]TQN30659.1 putative MFS family arabinose efflux permease [Haloactinospora alba]